MTSVKDRHRGTLECGRYAWTLFFPARILGAQPAPALERVDLFSEAGSRRLVPLLWFVQSHPSVVRSCTPAFVRPTASRLFLRASTLLAPFLTFISGRTLLIRRRVSLVSGSMLPTVCQSGSACMARGRRRFRSDYLRGFLYRPCDPTDRFSTDPGAAMVADTMFGSSVCSPAPWWERLLSAPRPPAGPSSMVPRLPDRRTQRYDERLQLASHR